MSMASRGDRSRRAPARKPALSRERVVGAALALADREGITRLTMRAVAEELDGAVMSLYRHIANKDDLLQEIADAAMADCEPVPSGLRWDDAAAALYRSLRATLLRHPSLGQVYADRPITGPNILAFTDSALGVLLDAPFERERAVSAFTALTTYTVGATLFQIGRTTGSAPLSADRLRLEGIQRAGSVGLDALASVADLMVIRGTPAQFEYGLTRLLDGLRADREASRRRPAKKAMAKVPPNGVTPPQRGPRPGPVPPQ